MWPRISGHEEAIQGTILREGNVGPNRRVILSFCSDITVLSGNNHTLDNTI